MRPRFFVTAQEGLDQISQVLGRAYAPPEPPAPARAFSLMPLLPIAGSIVFILGIILAPIFLLGHLAEKETQSWQSTRDPGTHYFSVELPDGRHIVATSRGFERRWDDLPWTGNHIGDAIFVGNPITGGHMFVWINPLGKTNATPTWIDP